MRSLKITFVINFCFVFQANHISVYHIPLNTDTDPFQVLNHGDTWVNNILFKRNNEQPIDLKFVSNSHDRLQHLLNKVFLYLQIDYQLSFYTSPGYDLSYFLMMSPDYETRETKQETLLEDYRLEFNQKLKEYNYRKDFYLSEELLDKVMKHKSIYAFNMMLTVFPATTRKSSDFAGENTTAMFVNEKERGRAMREIFANERLVKYMKLELKKFNRMGVLDVEL